MKAFLLALAFFCLIAVATGFFFEYGISRSATEAYSTGSARVGEEGTPAARAWGGES